MENNSTPETTVTPAVTETPTETKEQVTSVSPAKILEGVHNLCNTTLYVLTHSMYRGEDAHLVLQAKEFVKEIRKDVEAKQKQVANGQAVNLG